ncbi:MAG: HEAT repeat domain-containing protein [Polyangiaceae bacterium]|nr:HEAT repeat domain-containing protein [Polyangiaceae bacterium]
MRRAVTALALLSAFAFGPSSTALADVPASRDRDTAKPIGGTGSLTELFGVGPAKRLLLSDKLEDRVRGVERLGALGSDDAIEALVASLEGGGSSISDTMVRLAAVRVLAAHTDKDPARQVLVRELTTPVGPEARGTISPLSGILRRTAALALARAGTKKTTVPLLLAVERGGLSGDAATFALKVHPPTMLETFLEPKKKLSASQITFLGELGDLRAIEHLRPFLSENETDAKLASVVALAKLGDEKAAAAVTPWLKRGDPRLLKIAAEVLVLLGAPEAAPAVSALLASDITRDAGLALAQRSPSRALVAPITKVFDELSSDQKLQAISALGRIGGADAAKALSALVDAGITGEKPKVTEPESKDSKNEKGTKKAGKPSKKDPEPTEAETPKGTLSAQASTALFVLAKMPNEEAKTAIEKWSSSAKEDVIGRALVRAALLRALTRSESVAGLQGKLEGWLNSKDASSRSVAVLGLVAIGVKDPADFVALCTEKKCDEAALFAAARGALSRSSANLAPFMDLIEKPWARGEDLAKPKAIAIAAGVGLLIDPSGRKVPTSTLAAWAESGGPLAPLAARALPTRDDDVTRERIKRLLKGTDPVVRAHVALGLGKDPEHDAVSLLVEAYRFEDDASVRGAIIRALSQRTEKQRIETLEIARSLDPDDSVRGLARAALAGRSLMPTATLAQAVAWVTIMDNEAGTSAPPRSGRLVRSDGVAVPFVADPDGVLFLPGLSHQKFNLQL